MPVGSAREELANARAFDSPFCVTFLKASGERRVMWCSKISKVGPRGRAHVTDLEIDRPRSFYLDRVISVEPFGLYPDEIA